MIFRGAPRRHGFSLIEMLLVLVLLAVVGAVLVLLLKETLEVERSQAEGFDNILHNNAVADQFRADVAQAEDAPQAWQTYKADAHTLILRMPNIRHVVYLWQEGKLHRRAFENQETSQRLLPVREGQVEVEFVRSESNPKLLSLRLHALEKGSALPGQTLEIAAALGGDRR